MRTMKVTTTIVETIETHQGDDQIIEGTTQDFQGLVDDPEAVITVAVEEVESIADEDANDDSDDDV